MVFKYKTLEDGIDLLSKNNDNLWNHKFIEGYNHKCFVCNSLEDEHRSIKNILMRKISTIEEGPASFNFNCLPVTMARILEIKLSTTIKSVLLISIIGI